ncbi:hypothetical protein DFO70_1653 [Cytobacillus firmus]|uniref:Uncharacterized protein n=2 Tax=Cytobacillus TaxID=2675230 RepID=A0A366JC96_CYTFI|nr:MULTISPECIES: hypothetical protein [Cytobacillus]RBP84040.1 hypothetical protein DFO70_1653 [Cytobacillus firmus]TDX34345.1 hypothetical protein DFO72_1453 [Cytobacillus oceanisediminis]
MKKVFSTIALGTMALGVLFGAGSPIKPASANGADGQTVAKTAKEFHQGEKPLKVFKSEATGIEVEVYASNPDDAGKIKKEQGWKDNEPVKIMKDKDKAKNNEVKTSFNNAINATRSSLINNFGTIKASAHTDTGGWDVVGTEKWIMDKYWDLQTDTIWHSHGGDYMFRLPAHTSSGATGNGADPVGYAELYEDDGSLGDDYVGSWNYYPSSYSIDYIVRNIGSFVDGSYAEFYTTHAGNYSPPYGRIENVKYYD